MRLAHLLEKCHQIYSKIAPYSLIMTSLCKFSVNIELEYQNVFLELARTFKF